MHSEACGARLSSLASRIPASEPLPLKRVVSNHAREQFFARAHEATDEYIIETCTDDPRAVWQEDRESGAMVLVTYLAAPRRNR